MRFPQLADGLRVARAARMRHVLLAAVLTSACTGQITTSGSIPDTSPDAGGGGGGGGTDAGTDAAGFACRNKVNRVGSGNHHPGEDCQGSCHNHGFTLGGTLFAADATTPIAGATITVVDHAGKTLDVVSQTNGNFYTSQPIVFPLTVAASECPSVASMITQVTATMDGCNKGGCHVTGAQGRIHLP
jgi:hypothetical protein